MLLSSSQPLVCSSGLPKVVDIAAGWHTSAAIDEDGQVWIWGSNRWAQLTSDFKGSHSTVPVKVPGFGKTEGVMATQVYLGQDHSAMLDTEGMLWTWGCDDYGRLGHELKMDIMGAKVQQPTKVSYFVGEEGSAREDPLKLVHISCGLFHTLVLAETNQVFAFGKNHRSQLGCDTGAHVTKTQQFDCVFTPTPVPVLGQRVFANANFSGALDAEGRPITWGGGAPPNLVKRCAPVFCRPLFGLPYRSVVVYTLFCQVGNGNPFCGIARK